MLFPVDDEEDGGVAVGLGFEHGDGGAGDVQIVRPQPLPDYSATPPSDKPKFAGADVAVQGRRTICGGAGAKFAHGRIPDIS